MSDRKRLRQPGASDAGQASLSSDPYAAARAAAASVAPAEAWRCRLAGALAAASGARFVLVFTCPAGKPFEEQVAIEPPSFAGVVREIHGRFLARIERGGDGVALAPETGAEAYAPLLRTQQRALADELSREVLAPAGVRGLVNAFLVSGEAPPLGWLCLATAEPSEEALARHGAALTEVARVASATLASALDLARSLGAVEPRAADDALARLSARERQVAALVADGLTDLNVASRLAGSEETVGTHLRRAYRKLGIHSRAELVALLASGRRRGS